MANEGLGFSWDINFVEDVLYDYYSLSPEIENFPLTEDICAEIAYYDAMARYMAEEQEHYNQSKG